MSNSIKQQYQSPKGFYRKSTANFIRSIKKPNQFIISYTGMQNAKLGNLIH